MASDLRAFACHGLEEHGNGCVLGEEPVQEIGNQLNSLLNALPDMGARMEVVHGVAERCGPLYVIGHRLERVFPELRLFCRRVHGIRGMDKEWAKLPLLRGLPEMLNIALRIVLGLAAAGISHEELEA